MPPVTPIRYSFLLELGSLLASMTKKTFVGFDLGETPISSLDCTPLVLF